MDGLIKKDVIDQLVRDSRVDASKVSVEVNNGTVILNGEVPTYFSRSSAFEDARGILGVTDVINQLSVNYPAGVSVPVDSEIETNIENRFSSSPDIDPVDLEVIVNAGRVTLKGTVDAYWKKLHAEELTAIEPGVAMIENHLAVVPTDDIVDKAIAEDIINSLETKDGVDADDVTVRVKDGEVTLTGSVSTWTARKAADEATFYTAGVTNVTNRLSVASV